MSYFKLFREMWHYGQGRRWRIIAFIVFHSASMLGLLAVPLIFAQILNTLQTYEEGRVLPRVGFWISVWLGAVLWFNVCHRMGRWFEIDMSYRIKQRFLNRHYAVITNLPLKWHTDHHSGDTIDRVNLAAMALEEFTNIQFVYINFFMMFWGPIIGLSILSWHLSVITFVIACLALLLITQFDKRLVALYRVINAIRHKVSATFFDYVSNVRTIITLRLGRRTAREFDHQIEQGYAPLMAAEAWVNAWKWFVVSMTNVSTQAICVFYYIWQQLSAGETILIGNVSAVLHYGQQLSSTFGNFAREYQHVIQRRINLEAVEPITRALGARDIEDRPPESGWARVSIRDLTFAYEGAGPVLSGISFTFAKGERIALVGESGSGKSTLMAILRGLYEPTEVSAAIDGCEGHDLKSLFAITTLIPQEPEIFENTIGYNIQFGIDYPLEDVLHAVRLARFDPVLERLPNGLDTDVREKGVTLSGGERQRLALARGILAAKNSTVILMDEPTSSIDAMNEMQIYDNVFAHFEACTVISSIHRLHLLARFDKVIVMGGGRILQVGTFVELRDGDGPFQALWRKYLEAAYAEG